MTSHRFAASIGCCAALLLSASSPEGQTPPPASRLYNTVKQKLAEGRQVVGGTVSVPDPDVYCAVANAGFDFTWIEMQHSPLTYQDVARMVFACRGAAAIPVHPRARRHRGRHPESRRPGRAGHHPADGGHGGEGRGGGAVREVSAGGPAQPGRRPVRRAVGRHVPADGQRQHDGRGDDREPGRRGDRRADCRGAGHRRRVRGEHRSRQLLGAAAGGSEVRGDGDQRRRGDDEAGAEARRAAGVEGSRKRLHVLPGTRRSDADKVRDARVRSACSPPDARRRGVAAIEGRER